MTELISSTELRSQQLGVEVKRRGKTGRDIDSATSRCNSQRTSRVGMESREISKRMSKMKEDSFKNASRKYTANTGFDGDGTFILGSHQISRKKLWEK